MGGKEGVFKGIFVFFWSEFGILGSFWGGERYLRGDRMGVGFDRG